MKSKKILAVLMAAGMTLSLAACGSSSDSTDKSADNGSDSGKNYKIGILQQLEHAALAHWSAVVAFARIRSTLSATKLFAIVAQLACSPWPF